MTKTNLKIACAPLAIAAMAALNSTPLAAQSPQIVIDVPEAQTSATQPVTAAELTIVLPEPEPVVTEPLIITSEPIGTTTGEAPEEAVQPATMPAAVAPALAPTADPAPEIAATSPDEAVSNTDLLPTAAAPLPNEAELAVARSEMAPSVQPADGATSALILALLGVGGISLLVFFLMRRRRSDAPVIEKPNVTKTVEPNLEPVADSTPSFATPIADPAPTFAVPVTPSSGAAVELPPELPETFEERSSLLERMVAARPDRANPFRSPKARAKRARLIMQSIGTHFTGRKPRIDLSQYTNIWPELRGWRPATT